MIEDIKNLGLITAISLAHQRVVRGYDDRIFWSFDDYISWTIIPALKEFCRQELSDKQHMELNPEMKKVYTKTFTLIEEYEQEERGVIDDGKTLKKLLEYFAKNIGWYWT